MPKKESGRTPKESLTKRSPATKVKRHRYGRRTLAELGAYQKVLHEEATRLAALCRELAEIDAESVSFDGINRVDDGVELIYAFIDGVEMASRKEARDRRKSGADG